MWRLFIRGRRAHNGHTGSRRFMPDRPFCYERVIPLPLKVRDMVRAAVSSAIFWFYMDGRNGNDILNMYFHDPMTDICKISVRIKKPEKIDYLCWDCNKPIFVIFVINLHFSLKMTFWTNYFLQYVKYQDLLVVFSNLVTFWCSSLYFIPIKHGLRQSSSSLCCTSNEMLSDLVGTLI